MTFSEEFVLLFTELGYAAGICLLVGIIFVMIEMFVPGFGFFGIGGGILIFVGIGLRCANSGSGSPVFQFFMLLLITIIVLLLGLCLAIYSTKKGWISKTGIVMKNQVKNMKNVDTSELVGKVGVAITNLRPYGTAKIDKKVFEVTTEGEFLDSKTLIVVEKIEDHKIYVKKNI